MAAFDPDYALAVILQAQFNKEAKGEAKKRIEVTGNHKEKKKEKEIVSIAPYNGRKMPPSASLTDPEWELTDPTPDIHGLFLAFNERFFWGRLHGVEVRWSPRMTTCAGVCVYEGRHGLCSVRLSAPLLKLRPRSDLVETLLHEMIHAYLFVTNNDRDRDGHGPRFHEHMYRINKEAGTKITVYHSFHDEVRLYQQHWWRCDGPCRYRKPYYGFVKRAMNRAPGPYDFWYADHQATCGGTFIKVKEPEGVKKKENKDSKQENKRQKSPGSDIRGFLTSPNSNDPSSSLVKKNKPLNNVISFSDLNKLNVNKILNDNHKYPANKVNNIVGFSDLNSSSATKPNPESSGNSIGIKNSVSPNNIKKGKTTNSGNVLNKGRQNVPKSGGSIETGLKDLANNYEKKTGTSNGFQRGGGMVTNRGGGTFVVTDKRKQIKNDVTGANKSDDRGNNLRIDNFQPFQGTGFTLGGGGSNENDRFKSRLLHESPPKKMKIEEETVPVEDLTKEDGNSDNNCNCPVCNIQIHRNEMMLHLESCSGLQNVFNDTDNIELSDDDDDGDKNEDKDESTEQENRVTVPCPCCSKLFKESEINQHLDECLTMIALKEFQ